MGIWTGIDPHGPWNSTVGCKYWQARTKDDVEGQPYSTDDQSLVYQWEAMFKGVPFAVASDTKSGGRRIHVHEYPTKSWWDNEDLGRLRQTVDVQAYVYGDRCDFWAEKLFAACSDPDIGLLQLPLRVPVNARCMNVESTFNENAMGRMEFTMRFVLEPDLPKGVSTPSEWNVPSTYHENLVANASNDVVASARLTFEEKFTGSQKHVARREAAKVMRQVSQELKKASAQARIIPAQAAKIEQACKTIDRLADDFADKQRTESNKMSSSSAIYSQQISQIPLKSQPADKGLALRTSTGQTLPAVGSPDEGFGGALTLALKNMQNGAPDPGDLGQALRGLTEISISKQLLSKQSVGSANSVQDELTLAETVAAFTRRMAMAHTCLAGIKVARENQPDASLTRQRFIQNLDDEAFKAANENRVWTGIRKLRSSIAKFTSYYSQGGAATKRVIVKSQEPLAVIAANNYDKDKVSNRDKELMKLNNIRHPLFPPPEVSAFHQ